MEKKNKKMEEKEIALEANAVDFELDLDSSETTIKYEVPKNLIQTAEANKIERRLDDNLISPLTKKIIIVRWIPKNTGKITNPKHLLYGGIAENTTKIFTVPIQESGVFVNVLTDTEKDFMEYALGLEVNALSIYRKKDNFWDNFQVVLGKEDNYLDLSIPMDYIKYKVLLANHSLICKSIRDLEDRPKESYKYVLVEEGEADKRSKVGMTATMEAYKEFGKHEDNKDLLRTVLEIILQKPISTSTSLDSIHAQIDGIIKSNSKTFLRIIQDPYLNNKVLIKKAIQKGIIANRGNFLYLKKDNTPLCSNNEDPTLNTAAKFLSLPQNQDLRFNIEANIKD